MKHFAHTALLALMAAAAMPAQHDQPKRPAPGGTIEQPDPRPRERPPVSRQAGEDDEQRAAQAGRQAEADGTVDAAGDGTATMEGMVHREGAAGGEISTAGTASTACGHLALLDPVRIPPASAGEVVVVLTLMNSAVITADAQFRINYSRRQAPITLADWRIEPARAGTLPTRYRGQLVWDNTATLRIPVQVDGGTAHGKYPVDVQLEVPLTNGENGASMGLYRTSIRADVVVGPPVPRPGVNVAVSAPSASGGSGTAATDSNPGALGAGERAGVAPTAGGDAPASHSPSGDGAAPSPPPADAGMRGTGSGSGAGTPSPDGVLGGERDLLPWIVLGGAGLALLAIVLLRLRGR